MENENKEKEINSEEDIRQVTVKEVLILNYNRHIQTYVNNLVEVSWTKGRPQDEIVITLLQQTGQGLPPMERRIKAKEAQVRAREALNKEESILKVIANLIKEEDKKETTF